MDAAGSAVLALGAWWCSIRPFAKHPVVKVTPVESLAIAIVCGAVAHGLFWFGASLLLRWRRGDGS